MARRGENSTCGGCIVVAFIFLGVLGQCPKSPDTKPEPASERKAAVKVASRPTATEAQPPPAQRESRDISVTSLIVKKTGGSYRYFFDIRNNDSTEFSGSVAIKVFGFSSTVPNGGETFSTTKPIQPGLGNYVYVETYTGPTSISGAFGIKSFSFEVTELGNVVSSGGGDITNKYEEI